VWKINALTIVTHQFCINTFIFPNVQIYFWGEKYSRCCQAKELRLILRVNENKDEISPFLEIVKGQNQSQYCVIVHPF